MFFLLYLVVTCNAFLLTNFSNSDIPLVVGTDGITELPCGHTDEQLCKSVTDVQKLDQTLHTFIYSKGCIKETHVVVNCL